MFKVTCSLAKIPKLPIKTSTRMKENKLIEEKQIEKLSSGFDQFLYLQQ